MTEDAVPGPRYRRVLLKMSGEALLEIRPPAAGSGLQPLEPFGLALRAALVRPGGGGLA